MLYVLVRNIDLLKSDLLKGVLLWKIYGPRERGRNVPPTGSYRTPPPHQPTSKFTFHHTYIVHTFAHGLHKFV